MFYKITDKQSSTYQQLRSIRENEIRIERENAAKVETLLGFPITRFVGRISQNSLERVTIYSGFEFPEGIIPDPKAWKPSKEHRGIYVPNRRTKEGRNIYRQLCSLERSVTFWDIWEIVEAVSPYGSFQFPKVYLCGDTLLVYLDEQQTPKNTALVEITKTEFDRIFESAPERK